tara:strand:+ start:1491 stop:2177 length:687 start_codon:yes stop_codon:yes gene_type:complete
MNNLRTKIAISVISFVSFLGVQTTANSVEGFSVGLGYTSSVFMGKGKETATSGAATTVRHKMNEESGIFQDSVSSAFVEYNIGMVSFGVEYNLEDIKTPENKNIQTASTTTGTELTNTVKATFEDHTSIYANLNFTDNAYLKFGYLMADVATQESLGTGGAYPNVDTTGYTVGLGYQHNVDNGFFARIELAVSDYDDVSATNSNESDKKIEVNDMYGAHGSIKIGKSF